MTVPVRNISRILIAAAALGGLAAPAMAQQKIDATGVGDTSIFAPLHLNTPNAFRLGSGAPGPLYWQNRADYDIQASLDTAARVLTGHETLKYTNNSPVTLDYVWVQVEQDAFKEGSLNSYVYPQNSRFGARGFQGGDVIDRFEQVIPGKKNVPLTTRVSTTVMKVDLAEPLKPGKSTTFDIAWHFAIPEHGADRMGYDGSLFEFGQWYPRMVVYDDVKGWNIEPYLGQGEFYCEYGDFTLAATVPAGYIVAATGMLQNAAEVLTKPEIARLHAAARSDTTVHIVTQAELASGAARPRKSGTQTWKFVARNVRDVAWATSPEYIWDASSWKGILAQAYYRPSAVSPWSDAADQARMSIMEYSQRWFAYPYPQITVAEGPISGMEYPMLAMEARSRDVYGLYNVITHEIGHNWFPMIVGSNERMHFWQDEGFNTFINTFSEALRYPQKGDEAQRELEERQGVEQVMKAGYDTPIDVGPDRINPGLLGINQYEKTSMALHLLRRQVLGDSAFDDAFREYIHRWAYKHPTPADFFRTMEDASGRRLDWFWREFFETNDRFDQTVDTVVTRTMGDTEHVAVVYGNLARGVLPILARFTFSDGTTQDFRYPAEAWYMNSTKFLRQYAFAGKTLTKIELDPDHQLIDIDRTNNTWTSP
ncbi:MAG TPA: M1 family metallopeptidase [Gemmatimonadaceae bacterium]|nr:M1 family metallopeptidase [Gemmatimonadaceae bacterium]